MEATMQYTLLAALLGMLVAFVLFLPSSLVQWLRKKNYQYEVTFSLYMLTPTEKFVFNSILFLTTSMFTIGCVLYLPNHLSTVSRRVYYYFAGDADLTAATRNVATQTAGAIYKAGMSTAAAAREAMEGRGMA